MSTPRGRGILFFGAYIVFFIAIAILARTGGTSNGVSGGKVYETGSPLQFSLAGIESNNFKFTYHLEIDGVGSTITGVRTGTKEKATCTALNEYYMENNTYFVNNNGVWIKTSSPYAYKEFYDVEIIGSLIENASYVSKTEYESGNDVYTFKISSASISKILTDTDLDIEEIPNEILVGVDEGNYVNEVKFTLDSYCKVKGICMNSMRIVLNYDNFGEVEEIASPLE